MEKKKTTARKELSVKEVNEFLHRDIANFEKQIRRFARENGLDEDECWKICKPVRLKKKDFAKMSESERRIEMKKASDRIMTITDKDGKLCHCRFTFPQFLPMKIPHLQINLKSCR